MVIALNCIDSNNEFVEVIELDDNFFRYKILKWVNTVLKEEYNQKWDSHYEVKMKTC